jgi:hypothetical protein
MTFIIKNPNVSDYFLDVSYKDALASKSGIAPIYESGKFILLRDYKFEIDYDFLNSISLIEAQRDLDGRDVTRVQKLSYNYILSLDPNRPKSRIQEAIFKKAFAGNMNKFLYFQKQVKQGHEQILKLFKSLFPKYECFDLNGTWRFTPTLFENLHWDNFPDMDDRHQARIFINIDKNPRIWHTSYQIEEFCRENYGRLNLHKLKDANPNDVINFMDKNVLGGMENRCLDGFDRHCIAFEQGDIWLADSRLISHQIYQGNRAIIYMFHIKPESMDDSEKRFNRRIEKLHEQQIN